MLGSILSMAGTTYSAMKTKQAMNEANLSQNIDLNTFQSVMRNRLNREKNTDSTQLADQSAKLSDLQETLRRSSRSAEGRNTVMGGSSSAAAVAKEAANNAYAMGVRGVAALGQARQEKISEREDNLDKSMLSQRMQMEKDRMNQKTENYKMVNNAFATAGQGMENTESKVADYLIKKYGGA